MNDPSVPSITISYDLAKRLDWALEKFSETLSQLEEITNLIPEVQPRVQEVTNLNGYVAALSISLVSHVHRDNPEALTPLGIDREILAKTISVVQMYSRMNPSCNSDRFVNPNPETPHDRTEPTDSTFTEFKLTRDHPPGPSPQG
jgi:hypothetical protein